MKMHGILLSTQLPSLGRWANFEWTVKEAQHAKNAIRTHLSWVCSFAFRGMQMYVITCYASIGRKEMWIHKVSRIGSAEELTPKRALQAALWIEGNLSHGSEAVWWFYRCTLIYRSKREVCFSNHFFLLLRRLSIFGLRIRWQVSKSCRSEKSGWKEGGVRQDDVAERKVALRAYSGFCVFLPFLPCFWQVSWWLLELLVPKRHTYEWGWKFASSSTKLDGSGPFQIRFFALSVSFSITNDHKYYNFYDSGKISLHVSTLNDVSTNEHVYINIHMYRGKPHIKIFWRCSAMHNEMTVQNWALKINCNHSSDAAKFGYYIGMHTCTPVVLHSIMNVTRALTTHESRLQLPTLLKSKKKTKKFFMLFKIPSSNWAANKNTVISVQFLLTHLLRLLYYTYWHIDIWYLIGARVERNTK